MRDGAPTEAFWLFLVVGVLGAVINVALCAPLKEVRLENDELVVSNFRQEWRVPLSLVTDVTQNRWINLRPITVRLRSDVGFGTRIVFLPPVRVWRWPVDNDPEVNELRRMVGLSTRVS